MNIEKVFFEATDGMELVGLLHKGDVITNKIIISIHGMTSNCLKQRDDVIAQTVTKENVDFFCFNNRGNGIFNYSSKNINGEYKKQIVGTAFEDVEESYFDICGAILEMKKRGYENIYLQGHSLGCTKVVYTHERLRKENNELIKNIKAIILLSLVDIPKAQKVFLREKYDEVMNIALGNEKQGKLYELMPRYSFIHPISTRTYLRYFRDYENIDFARYYDEEYEYPELNNIKAPLFMRWGNVYEMIEQDAKDLVQMLNTKIKNNIKDINYIDGADHGYTDKYDILAQEILNFIINNADNTCI